MFSSIPKTAQEALEWPWEKYAPYYKELTERELNSDTLTQWMADWSAVAKLIHEVEARLYVATTLNTTDEEAEKGFDFFLENIYGESKAADQKLKEKLLESGLEPENFDIQVRNMRAQAALFREENLPLLAEEQKKVTVYDKIAGGHTVEWDGEEVTFPQLGPVFQEPDRARREKAWGLITSRWLQDRDTFNELWVEFMDLRAQITKNAGYGSYRDYRWQQLLRLDYSPEDCLEFADAIEKTVVPAANRIYKKYRDRLGVDTLRPWDLSSPWSFSLDPFGRPPLKPYEDAAELHSKGSTIFHKVDPALGKYFDILQEEGLLDLENRKGKAPGAYCIEYVVAERPFVFLNAVGLHDDVQTLLHEAGHAFHVFESVHLPYIQQLKYGYEIAEVASMAMELLSAPYLTKKEGGFYSEADAARARVEHLSAALLFWPYMAVVDAFQHWVYENHAAAADPANCDKKWGELWDRFLPGVDWSGLDDEKETGWHRKLHIFQVPFYYVDYGLAQLGAVQVWDNAQQDQAGAVRSYRKALSLGATRTLPDLFKAAGAKLAFDAGTLGKAVELMVNTIEELEAVA